MSHGARVRARIEAALRSIGDCDNAKAADIAFHMTDWLTDLDRYAAFCEAPDKLTDRQVEKLLMRFLAHVPNHVAAAGKLLLDAPVEDIFEVGAIAVNDDEDA